MKTRNLILSSLFLLFSIVGKAQVKTETFKVSGECGTCKKKIEASAKGAGATYALWDNDSKVLTVKYNNAATNKAKIEKAIAAVGYDTPDYKTTQQAYDGLDECCKYERTNTSAISCCDDAKCTTAACFKDGKCVKDAACCKGAECSTKDCCKKN